MASAFGVYADPAANYYSDPNYWRNMDWSRPEASALWQVAGWEQPSAKPDGETIKHRSVSIDGRVFDARWGSKIVGTHESLFTGFYAMVSSQNECVQIADDFTKRLGKPIVNDGAANFSFSPNAPLNLIAAGYQWDLGDTRISAICLGMVGSNANASKDDKDLVWTTRYSSISNSPKLVPKFALDCSQRAHVSNGSVEDRDIDKFDFWVDTQNKWVLNGNNIILSVAGTFRADDGTIEFSVAHNGTLIHYLIGRMTGSLEGISKKNGLPDVIISGVCESRSKKLLNPGNRM
jgi:hypothetical protein